MTSPPNITTITPPRVAFIDPRTGLISREWYRFLLNLLTRTNSGDEAIEGLLQSPSYADAASRIEQINADVQGLLQSATTAQSQLAVLASDVQALASGPIITPHTQQHRYGSFYDTTTQTAALANTAYAMTFNTTDMSQGVYVGSPTSRVYVDRIGVYNIQFSAQLDNTSGGNHLAYIWLRVNGVDVPNTASRVVLKGTDGDLVAAWNFLYNLRPGDYFELMWSVTDVAVQLVTAAAAAPVPAIPSVILTITDNINAYAD